MQIQSTDLKTRLVEFGDTLLNHYDQSRKGESIFDLNQTLLHINSTVNGNWFPPYNEKTGVFLNQSEYYNDDEGYNVELEPVNDLSFEGNDGIHDLFQESVSNCSFVASMISIISLDPYLLKDSIKIMTCDENVSKIGVTLFFNGCNRVILLNNQLPKNKKLTVKSTSNPDLLWPSFIEKAFLKVNGATYQDFPGSNFGMDCQILINWIPDYVPSNEITSSKLKELYGYFKDKKIILGLGTGKLSPKDCIKYNLVPNHDYSVLDIEENTDTLLGYELKVKNPWLNNGERIFKISEFELFQVLYVSWNPKIFKTKTQKNFIIPKNQSKIQNRGVSKCQQYSFTNPLNEPITVWCLLEEFLKPNHLLKTTTTTSSSSSSSSSPAAIANGSFNDDIDANNKSKNKLEILWYYTDHKLEKAFNSDYYQLYKKKVSDGSRFILSKLEIAPKSNVLAVIKSKNSNPITNSLTYFHNLDCDLQVEKAKPRYQFFKEVSDEWNLNNSGGNWTYSSFIKNPQFLLTVFNEDIEDNFTSLPVGIQLSLNTNEHVKANLLAFEQETLKFSFITQFNPKSLVPGISLKFEDGQIFHPNAVVSTNKRYIIVASTYNPKVLSPFEISVNSPNNFTIYKISTSLGLYQKSLTLQWANSNSKCVRMEIPRRSTLAINVIPQNSESQKDGYRPSIRASLYRLEREDYDMSLTNGLNSITPIVINEKFDNCISGIFVGGNDFEVNSGVYFLQVDRFEIGTGEFSVEVGSTYPITVS
ncbi:peptidase activity protein [[Candida] boidinii]|nr:peptidase activity protein [[Candida] boidinii]